MVDTTTRLGEPLTEQAIRHVNFFNGRLITQGDMARTQQAQQEALARLGQGVGAGVVRGLDVSLVDAAQRQLRVSAGLGLTAAGQALCLGNEQRLTLAPTPDGSAPASSASFGRCGTLAGGGYVAGNGLYLLTLAPLNVAEGKAPVLALDPGQARCNSDAIVEAVQLRLQRIPDSLLAPLGLAANPVGLPAIFRWRSAVAQACFGQPGLSAAHARPGVAPQPPGLLAQLTGVSLSDCELPLSLVYLTASDGIAFLDAWAVRRRVAGEPASQAWRAWFGPGLDALGEAQLAQFQQQLSEIPTAALAGLKAAEWFSWLPPGGFLDASGARRVDGLAFLQDRRPARTVPLAPGDVRALLAQALRRDPVDLRSTGAGPRMRLYAVDGGPQFFVREAPNAPHAEEVWLDGQRARLPGVQDVQTAIDELRARQCGERSVWPGQDAQALVDGLPDGADLTLCFEAGRHRWPKPLQLQGLGHVVLRGQGAGSVLSCREAEAAVIVGRCASLTVSDLAVEGGAVTRGRDGKGELASGLLGALTVLDVPSVHLARLSARCGDAAEAGAACIVVRQPATEGVAVAVAVEETAPERIFNRLKAPGKDDRAAGGAAPTQVCVTDCELLIGAGQIGLLCIDHALTDIQHNRLYADEAGAPAQRGIVVAGSAARTVTVAHNHVTHAAQGIAVGLSRHDAPDSAPLQVERVQVLHNRVQIGLGERDLQRNRFGIFIGNARSLALDGNQVTLPDERLGRQLALEAIRLTGAYGLMVRVTGNHSFGTRIGIRFSPVPPLPDLQDGQRQGVPACLWRFEGNLAEQASEVIAAEKDVLARLTATANLAV